MVKELRTDEDIDAFAREAAAIILAEQEEKSINASLKLTDNMPHGDSEYTDTDPILQAYFSVNE